MADRCLTVRGAPQARHEVDLHARKFEHRVNESQSRFIHLRRPAPQAKRSVALLHFPEPGAAETAGIAERLDRASRADDSKPSENGVEIFARRHTQLQRALYQADMM